ncbi:FlgD immunoglobulin-like domain containing protein [Reichenbachiella sp.]|uniref:FlgD immunoglobulin-like domain containing protein n=1 Tax=Reichenbachiella sp. TaxID=2184521 RepID=UPI00329A5440
MRRLIFILILFWITACHEKKVKKEVPLLPTSPSSIGTKEKPNARFEYEKTLLVDPKTNNIPRDIHKKELAFSKTIQSNQYSKLRTRSLDWSLAGPANVGGRTRALAIDVRDEQIILAGGVSGGMWRSTNGGLSWSRTTQASIINNVSSLVQDTRIGKRDIWYFGTGELNGNSARAPGARYRGDGIFKSTDGGESWDVLPSTSTGQPASFDSPFNYTWNLAIDPTTDFATDEVYAATYGNIVKSTDGGKTWEKVLGEPNLLVDGSGDLNNSNASFYTDILITPKGKMFAYLSTSTGEGFNGNNKGIFISEDGENWDNITPSGFTSFSERLVMSYAPSDENILYFLVEGSTIQLWKYANGIWFNRSTQIPDENSSFEAFDSQDSYNMTIKVHPDDPDIVFIGGTNLYRSTDGYATEVNVSQIGGYAVENENELYANHHPDQHELVFLDNSNEMLTANDGGVFKTFDNQSSSVSWVSLNNGYVTSQFYTIALSKDTGGHEIVGGLQDNGTYLKSQVEGSSNWNSVLGGDGGYCATTPKGLYWYMSFQEAGIFKISYDSEGNIDSWAKVDPTGVDRDNHLFIAPFVLDPNNYNRMYLAGDSAIWRNDNLTQIRFFKQTTTSTNWQVIEPISQPQDITALDVSTTSAHILYYGTSSGNIYRITNANQPVPLTEQVFAHEGYVSSICIDPNNAENVLVSYSNYNIVSLYYSNDGGQSFIDVGGNLEENIDGSGNGPSIRWAEIIALNDGGYKYFVGTSIGLYSADELIEQSTTWQQEGIDDIGNSVVTMIDYRSSDGKIVIATHGNGVFESSLGNTKEIIPNKQIGNNLIVNSGFPNPFVNEFHIRFTIPQLNPLAIHVTDVSGKIIRTILSTQQFDGDVTVSWDGKNDSGGLVQNGLYHYMIIYQGKTYGGKMLLNR